VYGKEELSKASKGEDYLERVVKFVPAEAVAAYLMIRGFAPAPNSNDAWPPMVEFIFYGVLVILTPIYYWFAGGKVPRKRLQTGMALLGFIAWSYGIGGPFFFHQLETALGARLVYPGLGGAIVVVCSLLFGLFEPKKR
jgi:hypothetical protein